MNDEKITRKVLQAAACGTCCICLQATPNMSTLCCAKAAHVTCFKKWLNIREECTFCRKECKKLQLEPYDDEISTGPEEDAQLSYGAYEHVVVDLDNSEIESEVYVIAVCDSFGCHNMAASACPNLRCGQCCHDTHNFLNH